MSETSTPVVENTNPEGGEKLSKKAQNRLLKEQQKAEKKAQGNKDKPQQQQKTEKKEETPVKTDNFGKMAMIVSSSREGKKFTNVVDINPTMKDQIIRVRCRIQGSRLQGANLCFLFLRDSSYTIQGVVCKSPENAKEMVQFAGAISKESVVEMEAVVSVAPKEITSTTQKDVELQIKSLFIVSEAQPLPMLIEDLSRNQDKLDEQQSKIDAIDEKIKALSLEDHAKKEELEMEKSKASEFVIVKIDKRLDNRCLDLRVPAHQAIFRLQSGVTQLFREFLLTLGFIEIHTPKIISSASESGASVFKLGYFDTHAYLAQSPQFYKQMAICSDFGKVFEIGPVFRAEKSLTHRHMTEFVGLDLEMTFREHYHEVLDTLDNLMTSIFEGIETRFAKELESIRAQYPFTDFKWKRPSPRLTFDEAAKMLEETGEVIKDNDINTAQEKKLGIIMKEKHGVDFYIIDKFYMTARPFYTMPDPNQPHLANAYDLFMRGEEICSGAQRIHDATLLEESAKKHGINIESIQSYIDSFKFGCQPHGGGGVGLERVVMLYLGIGNIRKTSMFPRDPYRITP
ncbi:aspartyl-tRNA synthetase [Tieghemostelium lacteum]|uniref:aspartate--tRNA ligase n=1 Tax=Tieghemostelium lacteum TaxID=361077 RepID=A0A151ZA27_TIELA|nr:aspartyl-tRNA synthetase [Tieghemostelium lacteum]|eukprot:KYQ90799.1 aspartyl-tRNA synthetase [Tieghemostelium lacteum]